MRKNHKLFALLVTLVAMFAAANFCAAQTSTSSVTGTVVDQDGKSVPGAKVIVKNEETGVQYPTTTTSTGDYTVSSLVPGLYTLTVSKDGFRTFVSQHNVLTVGAPLVVDAKMQLGSITETVQVEGSYERVDTSSAMLSDVIGRREVRDLPLNGRNPLNLMILEPGLVQRSSNNAGSGTHVNGSRDRAFNVTLDGIDINEPSVPNPQSNVYRLNTDNVQEYRIVTQSPTAEFGRNSGANIALATRSGTNAIHGTFYDYFRNPVLNANDWFNNLKGIERPNFKINQYGAEMGGPIFKNKTFWFASWQGQRLNYSQPIAKAFGGTPVVYTASARQGLFRYVTGTINGTSRNSTSLVDSQGNLLPSVPVCGGTVTTNCVATYSIPANDPSGIGLDTVMSKFFNAEPLPNDFTVGDGLNTAGFTWNPPSAAPEARWLARVDHQINQNNSIFVRYVIAFADTKLGDFLNARPEVFPGFPPLGEVARRPSNLAVSYRRVFSPQLVNDFTAGYARFLFDFPFGRANPAFPNIPPFNPSNVNSPFINQSGTARWLTTLQYVDNISYVHGAHTFRAGLNFRFLQHNDNRSFVGGVNNAPQLGFSSGTRTPGAAFNVPANCPSSGTPPAGCINSNDTGRLQNAINELLGIPATLSQAFFASGLNAYTASGLYTPGARFHQYDLYFQDEWKIRRNVTINAGVRYELNRPGKETNGRILRPDKPINNFNQTGLVTFVHKDTFWDRENADAIAPRIGIAWDPWSNGKTVVRAGYGIAFDTVSTFQFVPILGLVPGSSAGCSLSIDGSGNKTITQNCPLPSGADSRIAGGFPLSLGQPSVPPSSFTSPPVAPRTTAVFAGAVDPNLQNPTVHEWDLAIQRDLGKNVILQVGYIGKRGTHLFRAYDLNQLKLNGAGYLTDFINAQTNLAICQANSTSCRNAQAAAGVSSANQTSASFANWGLTGQVALPLWSQILGANTTSAWRNSTAVTNLQQNGAGAMASLFDSTFFLSSGSGTTLIPGVSNSVGAGFFRPNPQFQSIFYFDSGGDSFYHALQLQLRRQEKSLSFGAAYTFAKSIDNMSVDPVGATSGGAVGNNSRTPTDIYNFNVDRGRSDFDRRHVMTGYFIWDLPFGSGKRWGSDIPRAANQLIGGWSVTSLITFMTGEPFSVLSGRFTNSNIKNSRADIVSVTPPDTQLVLNVPGIVGPVVFPANVLPQLNASGSPFQTPAPGTNGKQGRNMFNGPKVWNVDFGVTKNFDLTERWKLQFRTDMFNVFNHPNFDNPLGSTDGSTAISSTNFARVCCSNVSFPNSTSLISVGEANRVVQFALRLSF
jgi:hypothetical protein